MHGIYISSGFLLIYGLVINYWEGRGGGLQNGKIVAHDRVKLFAPPF